MENMASSELDVMETSMLSQSSVVSTAGSLSMREKSQLKRRINKEHNSNFRAGYVPVNETYLHKAGIRGRKRYLLYTCFVVLLVTVVLNTAVTAWLLWIYHIRHRGMEPMEFSHSSAGYLLRFFDPARFESLALNGAFLGSRYNRSLTFTGTNSKFVMSAPESKNESVVLLPVHSPSTPATSVLTQGRVEIQKDLVRFTLDDLRLRAAGGKEFFSLSSMRVPRLKDLKNLHVGMVQTSQIKNTPNYEDLNIESWNQIRINGSGGVKTTSSKETEIKAENLHLISRNGTVVLDGRIVIKFTNADGVPKNATSDTKVNVKLCVCGRSGLLFTVPVWKPGVGCGSAMEKHPCAA